MIPTFSVGDPELFFFRIRYRYGSGSDLIYTVTDLDSYHYLPFTATFPGGRYGLGLLKITATLLPGYCCFAVVVTFRCAFCIH
jgi:hypothetical protein